MSGGGGLIAHLLGAAKAEDLTGRGLGLAVVLGLVGAQEGALAVESEPGRGTTFRVFLPLPDQALLPARKEEAVLSDPLPDRVWVLLVEDETQVRTMAQALLRRLGYEVVTAVDGVEAVEVFRRHQDWIGCVLLDLTQPRLDGWETLAALRALRPDLPVILASGYDEARAMEGAHAEQPQVFLPKPYSLADLKAALEKVIPFFKIGFIRHPEYESYSRNSVHWKANAACADCHRVNGQGLPDKFPALDKNPFVVGDPSKVIDTVLQGRKG